MLYESYKDKLERRQRRFERLWRFRLLFLLGFLLLLAGAAALMGVTGTVTAVSVPERFLYGEPLSMEASAVFGGADFEYRAQGTEAWSKTAPRAAGMYECRAVGTSIVGTDRPGEIFGFCIEPAAASVHVANKSIVYGEEPVFEANLRYDDELRVTKYLSEEIAGGYRISADPDGVTVVNGAGEDVTASYELTCNEDDVRETARALSVRTESVSFVYDGKAHSGEETELGGDGLAAGERIEAVFVSRTDAGREQNRISSLRIFDADGNETTAKYKISYDYGTLTVEPRKITVETTGETRVYDGEAHTYGEEWFSLTEGELADGERFELSSLLSATDAGEYRNAPTVRVFADGKETTGNYEIAKNFSSVEIQKRIVGVRTATASFPYDGQAHSDNGFEVLPAAAGRYVLADGHELSARAVSSVRDYAEEPVLNELTFTVSGGGRSLTQNYDVRIDEYGTLSIERRAVTVRAASGELVYNGQPQGVARFEPCEELVRGHYASATFPTFVDAATYENEPLAGRILDGSGNDVTGNYLVTWEKGSVTVSPRAVTLRTGSATDIVYDAQPHAAASASAVSGMLVAGHRVEAVYSSWTDVGEYDNTIDPATAQIFDGENDVTGNYTLSWESGKVIIKKRAVRIVSDDGSWVYDGTAHSKPTFKAEGLAEGHVYEASVTSSPSVTYVRDGRANTLVYSAEFIGEKGGENRIGNYEISYADGMLAVTKRPLTVVTLSNDAEWIYDGVARAYEEFEADYSAAEQLAGHEVRATFLVTDDMANAGSHENRCEAKVFAGGTDVSENYNISYRFGRVTVKKRPLLLETESHDFDYDDTAHEWRAFRETAGQPYGLLHGLGHIAEVVGATAVTEASTRANVLQFRISAGGVDVTGNYDVQATNGNIVVHPRKVTLRTGRDSTGTDSFEYDAQPHSAPTFTEKEGTLVEGHTLSAVYPERIDAGSEQNTATDVRITRGGTPVALSNYEITWEYGILEVKKREVQLQTDSGEFVYDAEEHRVTSYKERVNSLVVGHRLSAVYPMRIDKGTTVNEFTDWRIFAGETDVTENYEISWDTPGNIVVTARPVLVTTGSGTHVYDAKPFEVRTYEYERFNAETNSGLVTGHVLSAVVQEATTLVGAEKKENALDLVFTVMAGGQPVTDNYTFNVVHGTIEVTPRSVTVTPGSNEKMYDGKPLEERSCDYERFDAEKETGLVEGHIFRAEILTASALTNVGRSPNLLTYNITVTDEAGENVTQNYNFIRINGVLIVTPRPVSVFLGGGEWVYCGEARACENFTTDDMLLEGHEVQPAYSKFLNAGSYTNSADAARTKIFAGASEVTGNYEITIDNSNASIVIRRRPIIVSDPKGGTWVYDGQPHRSENFVCEEEGDDRGLLTSKGHTFGGAVGLSVTEITDVFDEARGVYTAVGTAANGIVSLAGTTLYSVTIKDRDNQFIEQNYEVIPGEMAPLRVKSPVVVHVYSYTKWYDGTPLTFESESDYFIELLPPDVQEEWVSVRLGGSMTEIGALTLDDVKSNSVCTVLSGEIDLTGENGFKFTGAEHPIEVTARPLGIRSISLSAERGTEPLSGDSATGDAYWVSYGWLLPGHKIVCEVTGILQPEENEAPNTLENIRILDGEGNDVTEYYDFASRLEFGTLRWLDSEDGGEETPPEALPERKKTE